MNSFCVLSGLNTYDMLQSVTTIIDVQAWTGPEGSRGIGTPRFPDNGHMKMVELSALSSGQLYTPGNILDTPFCYRLSRPKGHNAAGKLSQ